jgi:recombination protein RecT
MSQITTAIATRGESPGAQLVTQYRSDLAAVLPSHIKPITWERMAKGALKRGKQDPSGKYELEIAAGNNPGAFLQALMEAARLGLEPGTEEYYLTPRKVKGRLEILGIVGYQGIIELMHRAGAISSVVAENVYSNDKFRYQPGVDEVPHHEIDWDTDDRGTLRLVYAYANMVGGSTSKVVVLNKAAIERIKASSQGSASEYSPWVKHAEAMWLKSAVRQLRKWVPTSAEFMREKLRNLQVANTTDVATMTADVNPLADMHYMEDQVAVEAVPAGVDAITGEIVDDTPTEPMASTDQLREIAGILDCPKDQILAGISAVLGREVTSGADLTHAEAAHVIGKLTDGVAA